MELGALVREFSGAPGHGIIDPIAEAGLRQPEVAYKLRTRTCSHELSTEASFDASDSEATLELEASPLGGATFEAHYALHEEEVLGRGASGAVRRATCQVSGRHVAVKSFNKPSMRPKDLGYLRSELEVLKDVVHPNVVAVEGIYETEEAVHLVMEELEGGEVFDRLRMRRRFREAEAAGIAAQTLQALAGLHAQGMAHRDVKPENLLYTCMDGHTVKLVDFGFAVRMGRSGMTAQCGTLGYAAPEIMSGRPYDEQCDMWSLGSMLYLLLTGRPLLEGSEQELLRQTREYHEPDVNMEFWCLHEDAQDFLRSLLQATPSKRPSAAQALRHPWLLRVMPQEAIAAETA